MTKVGEYAIRDIYQGGYSSLDPNRSYSTGYVTAGSLGLTTDPRSANVIKETSGKLSTGVKKIELALVTPEIFDSIPKQQLEEVKRLSKLTGIDVSVHGPVMDSAGITQQGFSEVNRESSERKIADVIKRSHEVDPSGNMPVVFHSAEGIAGTELETLGDQRKAKRMIAVDRESGKMIPLEKDIRYDLGEGRREISAEENLNIANSSEWTNSLRQIEFNRESAERVLQDIHPRYREAYLTGDKTTLNADGREEVNRVHSAAELMEQASLSAGSAFDKAYTLAKKDQGRARTSEEKKQAQLVLNHLDNVSKQYGKILGYDKKDEKGRPPIQSYDPKLQSQAMLYLLQGLKQVRPRIFAPMEEFATGKKLKEMKRGEYRVGQAEARAEQAADEAAELSDEFSQGGLAYMLGE